MYLLRKLLAALKLREAIKLADNAHARNGHRYFVMPADDGKLIVMDRYNFRRLKLKHYIKSEVKMRDLINGSFYFTPTASGNGYLSEDDRERKVQNYFKWAELQRRRAKTRRPRR
ncbi:MAG: hypothetical protein K2I18_08535 [Paramuribaculum sp.]|nr:hypothetical protein [Paramuribaculum sp.]